MPRGTEITVEPCVIRPLPSRRKTRSLLSLQTETRSALIWTGVRDAGLLRVGDETAGRDRTQKEQQRSDSASKWRRRGHKPLPGVLPGSIVHDWNRTS